MEEEWYGRSSGEEDIMVWKGSKSWAFLFMFGRSSVFPLKIVWGSWAPTKVGLFALEETWGRILTMNQLKRRG